MIGIKRRVLARIIAFPSAIILALSTALIADNAEARSTRRALENGYMRSVGDLARSLEMVKDALNKSMYAGSSHMLGELSAHLDNAAAAAKTSLACLPVSEVDLTNTYSFLSRLGRGVVAEDSGSIARLYQHADALAEKFRDLESRLYEGSLTAEDIFGELEDIDFSDDIPQREPLMLRFEHEVSLDEAVEAAARITGKSGDRLELLYEEGGAMPSYVLGDESVSVAITKAGGHLSYMLGYREVESSRITTEQATASAERFLGRLGINEIAKTRHETRDNVCVVSFAGVQGDVILYTDLIKVAVALDTGEVLSVDRRGWLANHNPDGRALAPPVLSEREAAEKLSPLLAAGEARLCLLPSAGRGEVLCYEFACVGPTGQQILVYINAENGHEEQILLTGVFATVKPPEVPAVLGEVDYNNEIVRTALSLVGVPFARNGSSPDEGFDSSGFIYYVLRQNGFANCPRALREQTVMGDRVESMSELRAGDLVFFSESFREADFGGIYIGGGKMAACRTVGEVVNEFDIMTDYYREHFFAGIRVL